MSRPLLRTKELRHRVDCYFNLKEQAEIETKALEAGLSKSAFIRKATLGAKIQSLPKANLQIWQELAHTTSNLNQIAHHLNSGSAYGIHPDLIDELSSQVQQLRLELLGAAK